MERRYHSCGYPMWMRDVDQDQPNARMFYKELAPDTYAAITTCPQCGAHLSEATMRPEALDAARALQTWMGMWPELRRQIELMIANQGRESDFYAYHAARDIVEFEQALYEITDLVTQLAKPVTSS